MPKKQKTKQAGGGGLRDRRDQAEIPRPGVWEDFSVRVCVKCSQLQPGDSPTGLAGLGRGRPGRHPCLTTVSGAATWREIRQAAESARDCC